MRKARKRMLRQNEKEGEDYKPAPENTLGEKRIKKSIMRKGRLTRRRKGRITNLPLRTLWGKENTEKPLGER